MTDKRILFGNFEFPRMSGLKYLMDERGPTTDYLFVNEPHDGFSMYFETDFPTFTLPEEGNRSYALLEMRRPDRTIKVFCPEKHKNLSAVVWYFYVELFDKQGVAHRLPGQVRVRLTEPFLRIGHATPQFLEVLEQVSLRQEPVTA